MVALYVRISKNGQFLTAMTTIAPNAKGGKVLHPEVSSFCSTINVLLTNAYSKRG